MKCFTQKGLIEIEGKVLILGDSISDIGNYVSFLNCYFAITKNSSVNIINAGVSSETCSGLSEPAHPFPRPCVHNRVDRAIATIQPDWVILSYGINDGIYYPQSDERFAAYKNGMTELVKKVQASGAKAIVLTPLAFDADSGIPTAPITEKEFSFMCPYIHYDDVLADYADWVMSDCAKIADAVVDVRTPFLQDIIEMRKIDPKYDSGDGIHPSWHSSYIYAKAILNGLFGVETDCLEALLLKENRRLFNLVYERDQLEHFYYKEKIGHDNPFKNEVKPNWQSLVDELNNEISRYLAADSELLISHSAFNGYDCDEFFNADGYEVVIAKPKYHKADNEWVWRTEFFGAFPSVDIDLLGKGWYIAQVKIVNMYGCPHSVELMEKFRIEIAKRYSLKATPVVFGFSRGALYALNYAVNYPKNVKLLYLDAPVVDTQSWPNGDYSGVGSKLDSMQCAAAYGNNFDEKARIADAVAKLAASAIPLLLVAGDSDTVVPFAENGIILQKAYEANSLPLKVMIKNGCDHHPHSYDNPAELVEFILGNI